MPTTSAPAASAFATLSPCVNTATRTVLPVPFGSTTAPRTFWSDFLASTPRLTLTSIDSSNFEVAHSLISANASSIAYRLPISTLAAMSFCFFVKLAI